MQKTVRKKVYDTDTAALLGTVTSGLFGDPAGYEERLYQTPEGFYFLYGLGGDASPYPKETIKPASATTAGVMSKASRARVTIVLPSPTSRPALSKSKAVEKGATASMMS